MTALEQLEQLGVGALDLADVPAAYTYVFVETCHLTGKALPPRYHVHVEACSSVGARNVAESITWACPHRMVYVGLSALIVSKLAPNERCDDCAPFVRPGEPHAHS